MCVSITVSLRWPWPGDSLTEPLAAWDSSTFQLASLRLRVSASHVSQPDYESESLAASSPATFRKLQVKLAAVDLEFRLAAPAEVFRFRIKNAFLILPPTMTQCQWLLTVNNLKFYFMRCNLARPVSLDQLLLKKNKALSIRKVPIANPCEKPWFLHLRILAKVHLRILAEACRSLRNHKLRKLAKACESLRNTVALLNHICEFARKHPKACEIIFARACET